MKINKERLQAVKAFVFDIDGVLTNNMVLLASDGQVLRQMNSKDGFALQYASRKGYKIAFITGGNNQVVKERLQELCNAEVYLLSKHKWPVMQEYLSKHGLSASEIAYMGDDLPDYEVLQQAGIAACPADAVPEIREICTFVSSFRAGETCVRELIETVLKERGDWFHKEDLYW